MLKSILLFNLIMGFAFFSQASSAAKSETTSHSSECGLDWHPTIQDSQWPRNCEIASRNGMIVETVSKGQKTTDTISIGDIQKMCHNFFKSAKGGDPKEAERFCLPY